MNKPAVAATCAQEDISFMRDFTGNSLLRLREFLKIDFDLLIICEIF